MILKEYIIHFPKDWFKSYSSCKNWAIEFVKLTNPAAKWDAWEITSIDSFSYSYCVTRLYKDESIS